MSVDLADQLVFDIGMHDGNDSAQYLKLGYRVVGVEANPILAAKCRERFNNECAAGRMNVLNVGILRQQGEFTFYRSPVNDGHSSFLRSWVGDNCEDLTIQCIPAIDLVSRFGRPVFIKVDIEGADAQVLESLTVETAPKYISLEIGYDSPILEMLVALGYDSFKFVNGATYRAPHEILPDEYAWRLLRKATRRIPPLLSVIRWLPRTFRARSEFDDPGKYGGSENGAHGSGPFGEQVDGPWLTAAQARCWLNRVTSGYKKMGSGAFWWDIHARHSTDFSGLNQPRRQPT